MYNFNGQLFDSNLNPVGGTLTPDQVQQGGNTVLQLQDMKDMQVYQTTPDANLSALYVKAREDGAKELSGGLNIKPPSKMRMCLDMMGGLLIGYFAARTGGASGTGAMLVGLTAAASNRDADQQLIDRAEIARKMFKGGGYTEDALYNYYRTGDDSGLKAETSSIAQDRRQGINVDAANDRQDKQLDQQMKIHNDTMNHQDIWHKDTQNRLANGGMGALTDQNGNLTWHGMNAGTALAGKVAQMKAPYIKNLQTRMAKLASAKSMAAAVQADIARGDYTQAQSDYNLFTSDLAQAEKGGNAAITPEEREQVSKLGSLLNQWENKARTMTGFTPNAETMNSVFGTFNNVANNDENAINNEVQKEVANIGGGVIDPAIQKYAASILMNQSINEIQNESNQALSNENVATTSTSTSGNSSQVQLSNSQLTSHIGEATDHPNGYTVSNGTITLVAENGKWTVKD